jgi:hypothetical protein
MVKKIGLSLKKLKEFKHKEIIVFSLIMLVIYLLTLSCSFDDEDSILFLKGVRQFNVSDWSPHPPGYPGYIFLGKISHTVINNELLALTILSAIFGALSLLIFYLLVLEMFNKKIALTATMILAITPLFWLNSLQAMTDMTGLFFILLSMYFVYLFIKTDKINNLYLGSFIFAIAIGVRFHAIFIFIPLIIYSYFKMKNKRKIFWVLLVFLIGVLIWFIPMVIVNGLGEYFKAVLDQFLRRFEDPTWATAGGNFSFNYLLSRGGSFLYYFLAAGYGINLWAFNILGVLYLLFFISVLMMSYKRLKNKVILFFLIALTPNIIIVFLFLPPPNPRYFISFIPFISLLFTLGIFGFRKYSLIVFLIFFSLLLIITLPLVKEIHTVPSPPTQVINYISENYENLNEIIIYRDPILEGYFKINNLSASSLPPLFFLKRISYSNKTILLVKASNQEPLEPLNFTLIKEFKRSLGVAPKISFVNLYRLS